jgi:hypothetical protein
MPKALTPQKLMIAYVRCMMSNDVLNLFLLCINNHNQDKEHVNVANEMGRPLV